MTRTQSRHVQIRNNLQRNGPLAVSLNDTAFLPGVSGDIEDAEDSDDCGDLGDFGDFGDFGVLGDFDPFGVLQTFP